MNDKQISFSSVPCPDEIKLTELTTLKASYEFLKKRHRGSQKMLEKEFQTMVKAIDDYKKAKSEDDARNSLGEFLEDVSRLKRKAETLISEELNYTKTCKMRLDHLMNLSDSRSSITSSSPNAPTYSRYNKTGLLTNHQEQISESPHNVARLQRHLADHLFAQGCCQSALEMAKSINTTSTSPPPQPPLTPTSSDLTTETQLGLVEIYEEALQVISALREGDTRPLDMWLMGTQYKFKKPDSDKNSLKTDLQIFKLFLKIKEGKYEESIKLAQSFCDGQTIEQNTLDKLSKVMTLMVFRSRDDLINAAKEWSVDEDWIINQFHRFILQFYSFYEQPSTILSLIINTGISVRKTDACYHDSSRRPQCVICRDPINTVSHTMPSAHYDHSILVCWRTGLHMDEHNPPLAFPNGYVYCAKAIPDLKQGDEVVCPRSGLRCKEKDLQKVFIV